VILDDVFDLVSMKRAFSQQTQDHKSGGHPDLLSDIYYLVYYRRNNHLSTAVGGKASPLSTCARGLKSLLRTGGTLHEPDRERADRLARFAKHLEPALAVEGDVLLGLGIQIASDGDGRPRTASSAFPRHRLARKIENRMKQRASGPATLRGGRDAQDPQVLVRLTHQLTVLPINEPHHPKESIP